MKAIDYFPFIKLIMLSGLLVFYAFWYVPSMRSEHAYRLAMDQVFNRSQACSEEAWAGANYAAITPCYSEWDKWSAENSNPELLGWHSPWFVWTEKKQ